VRKRASHYWHIILNGLAIFCAIFETDHEKNHTVAGLAPATALRLMVFTWPRGRVLFRRRVGNTRLQVCRVNSQQRWQQS